MPDTHAASPLRRARRVVPGAFALVMLAFAPAARAQVWNEVGDAGPLVGSAQSTIGIGALTTINGTLASPNDVDVYCVQLTEPPRAILPVVSLQCAVQQGPNVWLFDATGKGVATNATCAGGVKSFGTALVSTPGTYYVAVSYSGVDPFSGPDAIWLPAIGGERSPDGPGSAGSLTAWAGTPVVQPLNPYQIGLNFIAYCDAATPAAKPSWGSLKIRYGL